MKRKGIIAIIVLSVALIVSLIILIIVVKGKESPIPSLQTDNLSDDELAVYNSYISDNISEIKESSEGGYIHSLILDKVYFEITDKNDTELYLKIQSPDLQKIIDGLQNKDFSSLTIGEAKAECEKEIKTTLENNDFDVLTSDVKVNYTINDNGKMEIQYNSDYINALFGGMYSYVNGNWEEENK